MADEQSDKAARDLAAATEKKIKDLQDQAAKAEARAKAAELQLATKAKGEAQVVDQVETLVKRMTEGDVDAVLQVAKVCHGAALGIQPARELLDKIRAEASDQGEESSKAFMDTLVDAPRILGPELNTMFPGVDQLVPRKLPEPGEMLQAARHTLPWRYPHNADSLKKALALAAQN